MKKDKVKKVVEEHYSKIAAGGSCCSCSCGGNDESEKIAKSIGYADDDIADFSDSNLGLGCGNPVAMGSINEEDTVLDLGSGAGFDAFLAAKKVGESGNVIGIDFSKEMIKKAKENAKKFGYKNVEFKYGDVESMPVDDNFVDVVISNCVINLAPSKDKVFSEIKRVLKKSGRGYISDIVLLKKLSTEQLADENLLAGCVAGALLKDDYIKIAEMAGLSVRVLSEDRDISKRQYNGVALESLKIEVSSV